MLSCKEASKLISEREERKLSLLERVDLRMHLFVCASCRQFEKQMVFLKSALIKHFTGDNQPPTPLPRDSKERMLKAIKEQTDR